MIEVLMSPVMVDIAPGEFWMGAGEDDKFSNSCERPTHRVVIGRAFRIGKFPVTVSEFESLGDMRDGEPDWPVSGVSWFDATAYCEKLSQESGRKFRLPSEAEWEYAARGGTTGPFSWGDTIAPTMANYLYSEQGERMGVGHRTRIGLYPPNAWGLCDMAGNVCEWVQDVWQRDYVHDVSDGRLPTKLESDGAMRVLRGGAWDYMPRLLRCAWRDGLDATVRRDNVGFRLAEDIR